MLILDTAKAVAYYDHPFFGKYPAITRNQYRQRHLTYEGTVLSDKLQQIVLLLVLKEAGLVGADSDAPGSVRVKHGKNRNGNTLHFYLNYSSAPQTVNYGYGAGTDLLSQGAVSHDEKLTLKPWDAAIVEEKQGE